MMLRRPDPRSGPDHPGPGRRQVDAAARVSARAISGSSRDQNIVYARYLLPIVPFLSLAGRGGGGLAASACCGGTRFRGRSEARSSSRSCSSRSRPPSYTSVSATTPTPPRSWTNEQAYELDPAGAAARLERSPSRAARCSCLPTIKPIYVKQLRPASAGDYAGTGHPVSGRLLAGLRAVPREPAERIPTNTATTCGCFAQAEEVARFTPSKDHPGPELRILKVMP